MVLSPVAPQPALLPARGRAPVLTTIFSTSSGTLRRFWQRLKAEEWLKMTGALERFSTASMVSTETWARSTIMPRRFISASTICGNGDRDGDRVGEGCTRGHVTAWGDTMHSGHSLLGLTTQRGAGGCWYHVPPAPATAPRCRH